MVSEDSTSSVIVFPVTEKNVSKQAEMAVGDSSRSGVSLRVLTNICMMIDTMAK